MTRRSSVRAQAQEIYREMATQSPLIPAQAGIQGDDVTPVNEVPGSPLSRGRAEGDLTARVRKLYENSAVPVREIAALAGVTERTIYKYAQKGGWTVRYAWIDRGGTARRWRAKGTAAQVAPAKFAPDFTPVKGAGGRFVARADKDKPFARGLKATDRQGAARASAACVRAETIAVQAQADAEGLLWNESFILWLRTAADIRDQLTAYRQKRQQARRQKRPNGPAQETDAHEQCLTRAGHLALGYLEFCQAHLHEAMQRAVSAQAAGNR